MLLRVRTPALRSQISRTINFQVWVSKCSCLRMRFIGNLIEKLQRHPKRIVFPEGTEPRILQAARQFYSLRLGAPILLGDRTTIKTAAERLNVSLEGVRIINPAESEELDNFAHRFELLRRYKGIKEKEARSAMLN